MRNVLRTASRLLKAPAILLIALAPASCTTILGDFDGGAGQGAASDASTSDVTVIEKDTGTVGEGGGGKIIGASCAMDSQCNSGSCTDGVCCGSPCHGLCETCNLAGGMPGKCEPVAANTDPDMECVLAPTPDAGASPRDAGDAGNAAADDDGATDAAGGVVTTDADTTDGAGDGSTDGAPNIGYNVPEGGVIVHQSQCAGSCNGARACVFPDRAKACGTQFCNTSSQQASFVCDGTGNCGLDLEACSKYACENGACGSDSNTSCTGPSDCLDDSYCNANSKCAPKKQNSVGCSLPTECQTGFCSQGVCCNSSCDPTVVPGGTCVAPTKVGQCTCPACTTGACQLFYKDGDGDGQGDPNSTKVACAGSPPQGYVTNNSDCDDGNALVYVGQTQYFTTPSTTKGSFDYDCDGKAVGTPAVLPGASCGLCSVSTSCGVNSYSCTATVQTYLSCYVGFCHLPPIGIITAQSVLFSPGPIQTDIACGGCFGNASEGFTGTAACGQQASYVKCYDCYGTTSSPAATSSAQSSYTQPFPCH